MSKIHSIVAVSVFMGAMALTSPARAQIPVTDAANLAETIAMAIKTVEVAANTLEQVQKLAIQIDNQRQMLQSINPTSFAELKRLLAQGQFSYSMIQGDLESISFNIQTVNRDFDRLFPQKKQSQWANARYSDFNTYYDGWNSEITTSSKAAIRAQSNIKNVDGNNRQLAAILQQADSSSTGQVRQLQLINQQLALIHSELGGLVQILATTGRVLTEWTAGSVGEKMMARERDRRRLDGYTSRGRPPRVLRRLP